MEYRPLGRTGVTVSALCLGGMNIGSAMPDEEAFKIIDRAIDAGVNFIDTANRYGESGPRGPGGSEEVIGEALARSGKRDRVVLATKAHFQMDPTDPNSGGVSRRHLMAAVDDSLRRLRTDWIDVLQLHRDEPDVPLDETLSALADIVRSGKVRYVGGGFSAAWRFVESFMVSERIGAPRFVTGQPMYNLLVRQPERAFLPMAERFGLAVMAHSPLHGGFFSGRYRFEEGSADSGRFAEWGWAEALSPQAWHVLEEVRQIAESKDATVSQVATAWVLARPGVTTTIIGPRTLPHLEDSLEAVAMELTDDDLRRLDEVTVPRANLWHEPVPRPATGRPAGPPNGAPA